MIAIELKTAHMLTFVMCPVIFCQSQSFSKQIGHVIHLIQENCPIKVLVILHMYPFDDIINGIINTKNLYMSKAYVKPTVILHPILDRK